jgi:hypothetical protein
MKISNAIIVLAALALHCGSAHAATVNIVHGIDGRDLGASKELPVDIAVNGTCSLKGVRFTQSAEVELSPATYTVTVHAADGKCGRAPVISQTITIPKDQGRRFSAVASLTESGAPRLAVFNNSDDLLITPATAFRHLAAAGPVSVTFRNRDIGTPQTFRVRNGKTANLGVLGPRLRFSATVTAGSPRKQIARIEGESRRKFVIYNIVGSKTNGFSIITERIVP